MAFCLGYPVFTLFLPFIFGCFDLRTSTQLTFIIIMAENSQYQSNLRSNMNQTSRKITNIYMDKHFFLLTLRSNTTILSEFTGTLYILPLTSLNDVVNGIYGTDSCDAIYR